jgi:tRNA-dihydrouridine synthase B
MHPQQVLIMRKSIESGASTSQILYLAPLRGLTDAIFRNVYATFFSGIDLAVTPFMTTVEGFRIKPSHLKEVLPQHNSRMAIVPQVLSKSCGDFIALAHALFDLGHAGLNWNLGCPYPMVARKQRGSGMLPYPDAIDRFLDQALAVIPNRLSIKLRLGRFDRDEIYALLPIFNRYPIDALIIHPRTGVQMYDGVPDLDAFERCLGQTHLRVVYNGDITSLSGFECLKARFPGMNDWMIGRGVLSDPFLPGMLKGHAPSDDRLSHFKRFHDALFEEYGAILKGRHLVDKFKGFWTYFARSFPEGDKLRKQVHKAHSIERYREVVARLFEAGPCTQAAPQPAQWGG